MKGEIWHQADYPTPNTGGGYIVSGKAVSAAPRAYSVEDARLWAWTTATIRVKGSPELNLKLDEYFAKMFKENCGCDKVALRQEILDLAKQENIQEPVS